MRKWMLMTLSVLSVVALIGIALFGPRTVLLAQIGRPVVRATEPSGSPWDDRIVTISVDHANIFGVNKEFSDSPLFLYSFPDARRFLCIYDDDVLVAVFVVDLANSTTNLPIEQRWPSNDNLREVLERGATNIVTNCRGLVRLPTYAEVQKVSSNVGAWTPRQVKAASFPAMDLGFFQIHTLDKQFMLHAIDPNRTSSWPTN